MKCKTCRREINVDKEEYYMFPDGKYEHYRCKFNDTVIHPSHYCQGGTECIEAIKSALTEEEFRGYIKGNILKYTWRERYKKGDEDLKKAKWYVDYILEDNNDK